MSVFWKGTDAMKMIPVRDLIFPQEHYPRLRIDHNHVQRIVDAMAANAAFPPVIIWDKKKWIADGVHRTKAVERVLGPDGEVACVEKSYRDEAEFFRDAVRFNSEHGLVLTAEDRMHVLGLAEDLKITADDISNDLRLTVQAAAKLTTKPITSQLEVRKPVERVKPLFRPHTPEPEVPAPTIRSAIRPQHQRYKALLCEVIEWLEGDDIPSSDDWLMGRLRRLHEILEGMELTVQK